MIGQDRKWPAPRGVKPNFHLLRFVIADMLHNTQYHKFTRNRSGGGWILRCHGLVATATGAMLRSTSFPLRACAITAKSAGQSAEIYVRLHSVRLLNTHETTSAKELLFIRHILDPEMKSPGEVFLALHVVFYIRLLAIVPTKLLLVVW